MAQWQAVSESGASLLALSLKWCRKCDQVCPVDLFSKGLGPGGTYTYCKGCERAMKRQWCAENRDASRARCRTWRSANLEQERARSLEKSRRARSTPEGMIRARISRRFLEVLRGIAPKGGRTFDALGYTPADLKAHLERQFTKGMSWENMGKWHIDHIVPLAAFQFSSTDDPEFKRAWGLPNLRPLWAHENHAKGARVVSLL